jgi:hypothetical protein
MKSWITRVVFLYISFAAAALSQYFYSTVGIGFNYLARDVFGLMLAALLSGIVLLAPFYYFAQKLHPSPRKLLGANVCDIGFGLLFIVVCILWIYFPQNQGFSFADGVGVIIDRGAITDYGHQVKLRQVLTCVLASSFYVLLYGIWQKSNGRN